MSSRAKTILNKCFLRRVFCVFCLITVCILFNYSATFQVSHCRVPRIVFLERKRDFKFYRIFVRRSRSCVYRRQASGIASVRSGSRVSEKNVTPDEIRAANRFSYRWKLSKFSENRMYSIRLFFDLLIDALCFPRARYSFRDRVTTVMNYRANLSICFVYFLANASAEWRARKTDEPVPRLNRQEGNPA